MPVGQGDQKKLSGPDRIRTLAEMVSYTRNSVRMNTLLLIRNHISTSEIEIPKEITEHVDALIKKNQGATNQELISMVSKNQGDLTKETYVFLKMMINSLEFKDLY